MKTLCFDTSSKTMSVSLFESELLVANYILNIKKNHSITLLPTIDQLLKDVSWTPGALKKIVVAKGPGSFTGIRIGVSVAKTLAYTLKIPLYAVSSLAMLAYNAYDYQGTLVVLFDARRENVYAGAYKFFDNGKLQNIIPDAHISLDNLFNVLKNKQNILFLGEDVVKFSEKIKKSLPHSKICANFLWNIPNSSNLVSVSRFSEPIIDIHGFIPGYLKLVEAEEKWLATRGSEEHADYKETRSVEKI